MDEGGPRRHRQRNTIPGSVAFDRVAAALTVFVLLMLVVVGCGARTTGVPSPTATTRASQMTQPTPLETTVIQITPTRPVPSASPTAGTPTPLPSPTVVTTPRPTAPAPTATPTPKAGSLLPGDTIFTSFWLTNANTGWLIESPCTGMASPTPGVATATPAPCASGLEETTDDGKTWHTVTVGVPGIVPLAIRFADAKHGWLSATTRQACREGTCLPLFCEAADCPSLIFVTSDGGKHWTKTYDAVQNARVYTANGTTTTASVAFSKLDFPTVRDGWALGQYCRKSGQGECQPVIFATQDGGYTWHQLTVPMNAGGFENFSLAHPTTKDGWIVSSSPPRSCAKVFATHDGGRTWSSVPDSSKRFCNAVRVFFLSPSDGWILDGAFAPIFEFQDKELYRTTNGGRTWTRIASPAVISANGHRNGLSKTGGIDGSGAITFVASTAPGAVPIGWLATEDGGLWHSVDGGRTWASSNVAPDSGPSWDAIQFVNPQDGWAMRGRQVIATTDGGKTWHTIREIVGG